MLAAKIDSFASILEEFPPERICNELLEQEDGRAASARIKRILRGPALSYSDFLFLLSDQALPHIEIIAGRAQQITRQRFGNTIELYAPLYLSNECRSSCTYCGFSFENKIKRKTLSIAEIESEASIIYQSGIRNVLLLTGEDYAKTSFSYIAEAARLLSRKFASVGIEVYPLKTEEYRSLRQSGVDQLTIYQETYDRKRYSEVHLRGKKKQYDYRLECPERAGRAGMRRINLGALLGLSDHPAFEVFATGLHAAYLMRHFWQSHISISLPRLRPAEGLSRVPYFSDAKFAQYLCALRLFLPDAGLNLSTREGALLRDHLSSICITRMSAGSHTEPGGYSGQEATEQFAISDHRSVAEIIAMLEKNGREAVLTDWNCHLK